MAEKFGDTLIVIPIESMQKGQSLGEYEPLPLHITVQPWFELDYREAFLNALANNMFEQRAFAVAPAGEADFGKPADLVREVKNTDTGRLARLHGSIGDLILRFGGELNPSLKEHKFKPHVNPVNDRHMPGEALVDSLQVVYRQADGKKLVGRRYGFKKGR